MGFKLMKEIKAKKIYEKMGLNQILIKKNLKKRD